MTRLGNDCVIMQILHGVGSTQHIIENKDGFVIRIIYKPHLDTIMMSCVATKQSQYHMKNHITLNTGNYRLLRAAMKAMIAMAKCHDLDRSVY